MNPNFSYTFNNITVEYTEEQKSLIIADQNLINTLIDQKNILVNGLLTQKSSLETSRNNWQGEYDYREGLIRESMYHLDNECNHYVSPKREECQQHWNNQWTAARAEQGPILEQINSLNSNINVIDQNLNANNTNGSVYQKNLQIASATKKLNDDITTIQNDIKLQIQTQLANTAANQGTAGSVATVNASNPQVLIQQQQLKNQLELAKLKAEQEAEKLKQEKQIKVFGLIFVVIIILGISFLVIRTVK